jgi:putative ABC transport system substrate-binding protein
MRDLGYIEGRSVAFEVRGADAKPERLAAAAAELVRLKVDVIVTSGAAAARAARQATGKIPIVMASGNPLEMGLVTSLARPGGNLTGVTTLSVELSGKRLEMAREVVPGASRLAILGDEGSPASVSGIQETQAVARALGVRLHAASVRGPADLGGAFSTIVNERPEVLLVTPSPMFFGERTRLAELAVKHRLPTVFSSPEYAEGTPGPADSSPRSSPRAAPRTSWPESGQAPCPPASKGSMELLADRDPEESGSRAARRSEQRGAHLLLGSVVPAATA